MERILHEAEERFVEVLLYLFIACWMAGEGLALWAYYLFTFTRKAAGGV